MQNWKATCTDGFTKTVMANTKEEAVTMLMADADMQAHVTSTHPEMVGKTPEEVTAVVSSMVQPEMPSQA